MEGQVHGVCVGGGGGVEVPPPAPLRVHACTPAGLCVCAVPFECLPHCAVCAGLCVCSVPLRLSVLCVQGSAFVLYRVTGVSSEVPQLLRLEDPVSLWQQGRLSVCMLT